MYERFTDRARKVMQLANQEAQRFNHEYIGTEHILLGLIKVGGGVAANVLKILGLDLHTIRLEIEKIVLSSPGEVSSRMLPQTPRAKKVVEYAIEEARNLKHDYIGTEHLLLGVLREQEGVAAQVLMNLGLKLEDVRKEVLDILGVPADLGENVAQEIQGAMSAQLDARLVHLPPDIIQVLERINSLIEKLVEEKEAAVAEQDFQRAAFLRERSDALQSKMQDIAQQLHRILRQSQDESS